MRQRLLFVVLISLVSWEGVCQSRKDRRNESAEQAPTSLHPGQQQKEYTPKASRRSAAKGPTYESEKAYYERLEALEKVKREERRMLSKPQYADPMYFGHKKPPKKRKPSKMKYCKVCGIRH